MNKKTCNVTNNSRMLVVKVSPFTYKVIQSAYSNEHGVILLTRNHTIGVRIGHYIQTEMPFDRPNLTQGYRKLSFLCSIAVWQFYNRWGNENLDRLSTMLDRIALDRFVAFLDGYTVNGKITDGIKAFYDIYEIEEDDYPLETASKYLQRHRHNNNKSK